MAANSVSALAPLMLILGLLLLLGLAGADLPVNTIFHGNRRANTTQCQSWWFPTFLQTHNETLFFGGCKFGVPSKSGNQVIIRSSDAGRTWSQPETAGWHIFDNGAPASGEAVYSTTTQRIVAVTGSPPLVRAPDSDFQGWQGFSSNSDAALAAVDPDAVDPRVYPKPKWAHQLARLTPKDLAKLHAKGPRAVSYSTDGARSFSSPKPIKVYNSVPGTEGYLGGGLNHGIEMQMGKYAGRLAMARRFSCGFGTCGTMDYQRSAVIFSDDNGASWNVSQLTPAGWTECQVAETKNGSLLLTSRMLGGPYINRSTDAVVKAMERRRGFARSDNGGHSWAEIWYIRDTQPGIEARQPTCSEALVSNPAAGNGSLFWGYPGNSSHARSNYTLRRSDDMGATWQFVNRVYAGGAGYSDAIVMPDGDGHSLAMAFQQTWDPADATVEGGGYDMGMARLPL